MPPTLLPSMSTYSAIRPVPNSMKPPTVPRTFPLTTPTWAVHEHQMWPRSPVLLPRANMTNHLCHVRHWHSTTAGRAVPLLSSLLPSACDRRQLTDIE